MDLDGRWKQCDNGGVADIVADTKGQPIERRYKSKAAREIDEVLRSVCTIDDAKKCACTDCPYREFFFGENVRINENDVIE